MNPNFLQIFRLIALTFFVIAFNSDLLGQNREVLEFKYKVDSLKVAKIYQYTVTITITQGTPNYIIHVFKINPALNDPFAEIHKSTPVKEIISSNLKSHIIPNIPKGTYYIEVRDNSKLPKGKTITF